MTMYVNVVNKNYSQQKVNIKFAVDCGSAPDRVFIILFKTNLVLTTKNRAKKSNSVHSFGTQPRAYNMVIRFYFYIHTDGRKQIVRSIGT